jgi:NADH-quinone oxidoreductase subunit M
MPTLLLLLLIVPALAAVAVALMGAGRARAIRWTSLGATGLSLLLTVTLAAVFATQREEESGRLPGTTEAPTFRPSFVPGAPAADARPTTWDLLRFGPGPGEAVQFYIGLDGLNVWLVLLTGVLMVSSVLVSWNSIDTRVPEFYAWLLGLQTALTGVFLAFDIVLFYVFFELTLVPLFFLIGIWGGPERRYAARKFFIYTLAGSLITLLGVLVVVLTGRSPRSMTCASRDLRGSFIGSTASAGSFWLWLPGSQ